MHTHSEYSPDSRTPLAEQARAGRAAGPALVCANHPKPIAGAPPPRPSLRGGAGPGRRRRKRRAPACRSGPGVRRDGRLRRPRRFRRGPPRRHRPRHALGNARTRAHALRPHPQVARTTEDRERRPLTGPGRAHVEDPSIEALASAAGRTDELAVRRQLFGWREVISTVIPVLLIVYFARNVDFGQALATIRGSNPLWVLTALVVYYMSFPVRAIRWARLLREGGTRIGGGELLANLLPRRVLHCPLPPQPGGPLPRPPPARG